MNPVDKSKLPKRVYANKYSYYYKPTDNVSITLGPLSMPMSEVWRKYEIEVNGQSKIMTFSKLWALFLKSQYYLELAPRTQDDYLKHEKKLLAVFGKVKADLIRPEDVRQFMDQRGLQSKTQANHEKASMSRAYRWGYERGYVKGNPCAGISKLKVIPRDYYISDEEYEAVYSFASDRLKVAMEIAYLCASRAGDVAKAKWLDELEAGFYIQQGKTGKKQIKAWTQRLRNALDLAKKAMPPKSRNDYIVVNTLGERLTIKTLNNWWVDAKQQASEKLGRPLSFTYHDIKAKGISDYTGSSKEKQLFSGHKTEQQVLTYDRKIAVTPSLDVPVISEQKNRFVN
ncbi:tyrosine-type recombinase/integrase [Limnobaculum xujianqingii]|uniref:tyrosine-type recombinase/integrase n=1 Tax=Limnobaculum xujianqingii TaxID=2738837 RepID=UPI00112D1671|nr:tyrosine-type recombinase/integrase [Limnobaculum xujianqingii]